jgi:osmotically-inducible protein OsmY
VLPFLLLETSMPMIVRTDPAYCPCEDTLAQAAIARLQQSPYHGLRQLRCACTDEGVLFLRGRVRSFYHKQLAQHAVLGLEGVTRVVNEVEVGV